MNKNVLYVTSEFYRFLNHNEPYIFLSKNLSLQEKVSGADKVVKFKFFSRPNKEIKYFSRT